MDLETIFYSLCEKFDIVIVRERFLTYGDNDTSATLDIVPYIQTTGYSCGFTVGLMVLHTFYPQKSINAFWNRVKSDEETGTPDTRLIKALRASGIGVSVRKNLTFDKIAEAIDEGCPIISSIRTEDPEVGHWIVIYGYGVKPNRLFIAGISYTGNGTWRKNEYLWSEMWHQLSPKGNGLVCWGK